MSRSTSATDIGSSAAKTGVPSAPPGLGTVVLSRGVGLVAAWAVQRGLVWAFRKRSGHAPPDAADVSRPALGAVGWAVVTAASLAATQVVVDRWSARRLQNAVIDDSAPAAG